MLVAIEMTAERLCRPNAERPNAGPLAP